VLKLGMVVRLGPGHIVLDGNPATPPQIGHGPQFSAHVCCGQTAALIKMPLGMEVEPGPPKKEYSTPTFWPTSIVAKGLDG